MRGTGKAPEGAGRGRNSPVAAVLVLLAGLGLTPQAAAQIVNTVTATGEYDGRTVTATATESVTVAGGGGLGDAMAMEKSSAATQVSRGQAVPYVLVLTNPAGDPQTGIEIVDVMPAGFAYVEGSARLDGVPAEPAVDGRELSWGGLALPAGGRIEITLALVAGPAVSAAEFINTSFARDARGRTIVSNTAQSKVLLRTEPVFDCSDVIGRVYTDVNRDGYYQDGEPGIAGARLATVNGLLVTTDAWGRYSIACPDIPDNSIGSNFILKLDERTLPQGHQVTSENPSTIRLTRGKIAKLDFGAAGARLVELELDERSFEPGTATPTAATIAALASLLDRLAPEPSRLRITYRAASAELSQKRLELVSSLVSSAWKAQPDRYDLPIETIYISE